MEVDTIVATLMSLGFDFDGCQQAILEGNSTVEAALEWLLQRGESKDVDEETRTQVSKPVSDSGPCHSFSIDVHKKDDKVVSRYAQDESQRKAQDEFEQRQRDNIQREARKRKLNDKQARQEILQQIKEDREIAACRRRKQGEYSATKSDEASAPSTSQRTLHSTKTACRLKIRLSSGKNITESCESSETLLDIITRIKKENNESEDVNIIQPFPHKTFTADDLEQSLLALGLSPGGCLVLKKISSAGIFSSASSQQTGNNNNERCSLSATTSAVVSDFGRLQDADPGDEENVDGEHVEDNAREDEENEPQAEDDVLAEGAIQGDPDVADMLRGQHVWGSGVPLGRHAYNPHAIDDVIHAESAAEAAEARSRIVHHQVEQPSELVLYLLSQHVPTLVDTCIKDIATRLPGHHHPVGSLTPISHRLCLKILKCLMKKKTLTPKTLSYFVPCQLQQLALDHYLYVTNELFYTIRFFKGLTHLSVQSCTVFTDKALEAIAGLKKIVHLDFSNCTQLTNKCLKHLKTHKNLELLKLDNTKVKHLFKHQ